VNPAVGPEKARSLVERIAAAVLYEGYALYPYRPSAVKNRQRWNFGVVCPQSYSAAQNGTEASLMQTECLLRPTSNARLSIRVKFLQLISREVAIPIDSQVNDSTIDLARFQLVPSLEHEGHLYQTWQEAVEREIGPIELDLRGSAHQSQTRSFEFQGNTDVEQLRSPDDGHICGVVIRRQDGLSGVVTVAIIRSGDLNDAGLAKVSVQVINTTSFDNAADKSRDEALLSSFVSTHAILNVHSGEFISLLDPSSELSELVATCNNVGTFPVMAGEKGTSDCMLSSPIILYDYPEIAAESPGDLFDGTEIDEILTLRIMTLTDEEKREMRESDVRAKQLLERTEMLPLEHFMKLHGVMKSMNRK